MGQWRQNPNSIVIICDFTAMYRAGSCTCGSLNQFIGPCQSETACLNRNSPNGQKGATKPLSITCVVRFMCGMGFLARHGDSLHQHSENPLHETANEDEQERRKVKSEGKEGGNYK